MDIDGIDSQRYCSINIDRVSVGDLNIDSDRRMLTQLACPQCSRTLRESGQELFCDNCGRKWPIIDGIPRFIKDTYYWGEVPPEVMRAINQRSLSEGWQRPVYELLLENYPDIYNYVTDVHRADFCYYLPLTADGVALDVGGGWGTISCLLASHYATVLSVESVTERVEFIKRRAGQDNLTNLQPIQANFLEMPLVESSLDLVVMNGVLEWIGIASKEEKPDVLQLNVLKKLYASLKPGGTLYIGIENRFAYPYFGGARDHSELRFTSLVPRWMADLIMQRKDQASRRTMQAKGTYRTYTYSYWGYRKLLNKAGFSQVEIYLVFPDYNRPYYLVPTANSQAFSYFLKYIYSASSTQMKMIKQLANWSAPFGLQRLFSPAFSIFARKSAQ
jgi:uncharacterized protein YbaR (Trm112 family)/ubiquinone/menaquinone biosynthesis C-methylase UbiE